MEYPLVSIIIPVYNHEKYVSYTLNSVLEDSYPNKEIVIINDGSKDKSDEIITNWVKIHGEIIFVNYLNRSNKGICATLNQLVERAKGKYTLVLASDDMLYGDTITQRVELLEKHEGDGKLVLVSDALIIDGHNNTTGLSSMVNNKGNKLKFKTDGGILEEMILNPSTVGAISLVNKSIYKIIGPYPEDLYLEDWFFYQRAAGLKAILFWDIPVSLYRIHSDNMSGTKISIQRKIDIANSVRISIFRNIKWFPSYYYKYLGITKLITVNWLLLKLKLKQLVKYE